MKEEVNLLGSFPMVISDYLTIATTQYSVGKVVSLYISIFEAKSGKHALKKYMYTINAKGFT